MGSLEVAEVYLAVALAVEVGVAVPQVAVPAGEALDDIQDFVEFEDAAHDKPVAAANDIVVHDKPVYIPDAAAKSVKVAYRRLGGNGVSRRLVLR